MNGQAKIDFENYVSNLKVAPYICMLDSIPKSYLNALIFDFFDSVGIYISVNKMELLDGFSYTILKEKYSYGAKEINRILATEKAIEKALELYNLKFKKDE